MGRWGEQAEGRKDALGGRKERWVPGGAEDGAGAKGAEHVLGGGGIRDLGCSDGWLGVAGLGTALAAVSPVLYA